MAALYSSFSRDPMCGMLMTESQVVATYHYIGQTYSFCCDECRDLFAHAPEQVIVQLAHEPEGYWGHRCPRQRKLLLKGHK